MPSMTGGVPGVPGDQLAMMTFDRRLLEEDADTLRDFLNGLLRHGNGPEVQDPLSEIAGALGASCGCLSNPSQTNKDEDNAEGQVSKKDGEGDNFPEVDKYKKHLDDAHLDAARRELKGEVVATKPDGSPFDHVTEVDEAMDGLRNRIESINNKLGSPSANLTDAQRSTLTKELGATSRLLDRAKDYLQ